MSISRRDFLQTTAAGSALVSIGVGAPGCGNFACQEADDIGGGIAEVLVEGDQLGGDELGHC